MRQLILDIRPDAAPSFDNYLPGPNGEALAALRELALHGGDEPVFYVWGDAGVGKSHLLRAWATLAGALLPPPGGPLPELPPARLAVDDVAALGPADQVRLFALINAAREEDGIVLAAGALPPARLPIRPDLATRLAQGLVFRLQPLSDADKAAAMTVRAQARGLRLSTEITQYLLTHTRRDLPHLLAVVDALDTYSLSRKRGVSVPLVREMLQHLPPA